ncbi:cordon-bleu protein-like 1 isoform X2 [Melanotaenia boesemani]|uniref:cordon-bleu protein-like 1 isoform X2 n=1 Tax=Melanotaenia boesemani TaxID=1250792 RepID=UPI001C0440C4|nr:cordon-bleu protein-like 1 isoform X2 [Melanotaenia boesemani]
MDSGDLPDLSWMTPEVSLMPTEMDGQVNPLERDYSLSVVLPGGLEENATVHGSKPVMDFLVTLCASYHLNPSDYTVEFLSPNKNNISFKPNSPVGLLDADKIVLKPRGIEEKTKRLYMPEATVRLLINYNTSHKTVVRVNPRLPLQMLLPVVCEKCEFNIETTILLRDAQSREKLDLSKTLNDHGLREVFAEDTSDHRVKTSAAAATPAEVISPPPLPELPKEKKQTKRGFFSLFRRRKKKQEAHVAASAPSSPGLSKQVWGVVSSESISTANTLPADLHTKRRAPPPPVGASLRVPNHLSTGHVEGAQRSGGSTLRSTKRRAPPPPGTNTLQDVRNDADVGDSLKTLEELRETDDSVNLSASSSSPHPLQSPRPSPTYLQEVPDPRLPSFRRRDFSDARSALAKVLTSSVSKGALAKRLRNSAAFPKFHVSSCVSMSPECLDNGLESALISSTRSPTGNKWEDPVERSGITTFKVVPSKHLSSCDPELMVDDPELMVDDPDQYQISAEDPESTAFPDVGNDQTEEDLCSPDGSESETRLHSPDSSQQDEDVASPPPLLHPASRNGPGPPLFQVRDAGRKRSDDGESSEEMPAAQSHCREDVNPESDVALEGPTEFIQSPTADLDPCSSDGKKDEEEEKHEEEEEEEVNFPPPPPPVFFTEDLDVTEKDGNNSAASIQASFQPDRPTSDPHATAFSEAQKTESTSAVPEQSLDRTNVAPSRFALAVAMAVQRSRLHSLGKDLRPQVSGSPHHTLPSPPRSTYQYGA